jgi:predicted phage baseplate assembly protein
VELRSRTRAVTLQDYQFLARRAAEGVARVQCIGVSDGEDVGTVKVLLVPSPPAPPSELQPEDLVPDDRIIEQVRRDLDQRRVIGARVLISQPVYQGVTVAARVRARDKVDPERLREDAMKALYDYLSPVTGGPEGKGWPFGRPVRLGEVYSLLQQVPGLDIVEEVRLFTADLATGNRSEPLQRIDIADDTLVLSYQHDVRVEASQ